MQTIDEFLNGLKERENSVKAPPRNALIAPQADLAKKIKALLNRYETKKVGSSNSPWNKYGAGHEIGSLIFGESPELLDDMSYGLNPLAKGRTGRIPIPDKRLLDMPIPTPAEGVLGVIKNKGGNWLTGSVENALKGLKKRGPFYKGHSDPNLALRDLEESIAAGERAGVSPGSLEFQKEQVPRLQRTSSMNNWIDGPLVNYIKNSMATPEDPIRLRADRLAKAARERLDRETEKIQSKYPVGDVRYNNSLNRAYARYDDEMLAALHYEPSDWMPDYGREIEQSRKKAGFPREGVASSELGKKWEEYTDNSLDVAPIRDWKSFDSEDPLTGEIYGNLHDTSPWAYKLPEDTMLYDFSSNTESMGFDHLIDEIGNALNPTSDLPANLRLTPEDLANPRRNSMEAMVDLVAKVNQHRRRMAIEAEKKSNEAIRDYPDWNVVKEYPDGYRMVRLPDVADSEEAFKIGKACGEKGGWCTQGDDMLEQYGSGDSRVNLLLDPDGKPVAQVETVANKPDIRTYLAEIQNNDPVKYNELVEKGREINPNYAYSGMQKYVESSPEYQGYLSNFTPNFTVGQIKGKHNAKPKAEHIPYLQDFVKSGNFLDVSDLSNVDLQKLGKDYLTKDEQLALLKRDNDFLEWVDKPDASDDELLNSYLNYRRLD